MFAIMSIDIRIDAEAIASTLASSLADNRPAEEHRGSISSRGRWTQRQNLPGRREAQAERRNSRNVPGNSEKNRSALCQGSPIQEQIWALKREANRKEGGT